MSDSEKKIILYAIDAGVGDCILLHIVDQDIKILIDSGPGRGRGRVNVQKALSKILKDNNKIDLAVLTHNDDDHIGGFSSLIKNGKIKIDTFIVNHSDYINSLFPVDDNKRSLKQDKKLQDDILKHQIKVESFYSEVDSKTLRSFSYNNMQFDFLSPDKAKLEKYNGVIEREKQKDQKRSRDENYDISQQEFNEIIDDLRTQDDFKEDNRPANGTSLAFRLQIGSKRFLFLGDAHPSLVSKELEKLDSNEFDLCKLSHHGGEKNTSQEFLSKFRCRNFLICSDGNNNHGHPSLKTFARVLIAQPDAKFYFNSDSEKIEKISELVQNSEVADSGYLRLEYEY